MQTQNKNVRDLEIFTVPVSALEENSTRGSDGRGHLTVFPAFPIQSWVAPAEIRGARKNGWSEKNTVQMGRAERNDRWYSDGGR